MSLPLRAAETVIVILAGLLIGWLARHRGMREQHSPRITRFVLTFGEPIPIALSLWGLKTSDAPAFLLPFLAVVLIVLMWPVGHLVGRRMGFRGPSLGAFVAAAMFSNVGITYGAFLCYALLGERGVALGYLYCSTFMLTFYTLGFWVASRYGQGGQSGLEALRVTLTRPESRNPILGVLVGLTLLALQVPRPHVASLLVDILVPCTTFSYMFAIGLSMHLRTMLGYWRPALVMHGLKFIISPILGLGLAYVARLHLLGPDLLPVMFIEAATPAAIMSLVLAQAKSLDVQLANACWLATNLTAVALAPLWLYIASLL